MREYGKRVPATHGVLGKFRRLRGTRLDSDLSFMRWLPSVAKDFDFDSLKDRTLAMKLEKVNIMSESRTH